MKDSHLTTLKSIIRQLYAVAIIAFLAYWLFSSRQVLIEVYKEADHVYLMLSAALWLAAHYFSVCIAQKIFRFFIGEVQFVDILKIHLKRLPFKYFPGGVWNTVARASDYSAFQFGPKGVAKYFLVENLLVAAVTFFLGGLMVFIFYQEPMFKVVSAIACLVGFTAIIVVAKNERFRLDNKKGGSFRGFYALLGASILYWLILSVSFLAFIMAFPAAGFQAGNFQIMAAYIFSWAIGFVAFFAPQGIGVSEVVTSQLLKSSFSSAEMITFLLGFRVIGFLVDNICYASYKIHEIIKPER